MDIPRIVATAGPAVLLLRGFDDSGRLVGLGSGFRVSGGRIATNAHVLEGAGRIEAFDKDGRLLGTTRFADALSSTVDIAILPRLGTNSYVLPIAGALPAVGEPVVVMGAPKGFANTVSEGIVSAHRVIEGQTLLQITAPISEGSSGGPVLNRYGQVVGVAVALYRDAQNLNFAVPASDLFAVMESPVARVPFPRDDPAAGNTATASTTARNQLRVGQALHGTLTANDLAIDDGRNYDIYQFQGTAGQSISIMVTSAAFDPMVTVGRFIGDSIDAVAVDDDSGGGVNSLANISLPLTGSYLIGVMPHAESSRKIGAYTIDLKAGFRPVAPTSVNASDDRWILAATSQNGHFRYDRRSVTRPSPGILRIWVKYLYNEPYTDQAGDTYDEELYQTELNCSRRQTRSTGAIQRLNGAVVWSPSGTRWSAWDPVVPGSTFEALLDKACR